MRKLLFALTIVTLAVLAAPADIGTEAQIKTALDLSSTDWARLRWAVGQHQKLSVADTVVVDGDTTITSIIRPATNAEAVAELKSRINEFVRRTEGQAGGDTLGQWGGI